MQGLPVQHPQQTLCNRIKLSEQRALYRQYIALDGILRYCDCKMFTKLCSTANVTRCMPIGQDHNYDRNVWHSQQWFNRKNNTEHTMATTVLTFVSAIDTYVIGNIVAKANLQEVCMTGAVLLWRALTCCTLA